MNDEIEKLWKYIENLEKRIQNLEQKDPNSKNKESYNPDDYLEKKYSLR